MKARALWVCAIPLAVLAIIQLLSLWLGFELRVDDDELLLRSLKLRASETSFHVIAIDWAIRQSSRLVLMSFCLWSLALCGVVWYVLVMGLERIAQRRQVLRLVAGAGIIVFICVWRFGDTGASATLLQISDLVTARTRIDYHGIYSLIYAWGMALTFWVAAAMAVVLIPDEHPGGAAAGPRDEEYLSRRMKWIRMILYTAAGFLATAIAVSYVRAMSLSAYVDKSATGVMQLMAQRSTLMFGAYYSLLLACMYAPVEAIVRIRATTLARAEGVKLDERAAWLKERHLQLNAVQAARPLLAMAAPVAVALFTRILDRITGLL
jgi:hypothetical protein